MDNSDNQPLKKNKMDIVDIEKLCAQYQAGFSIHKLSLIWNLPYVSLYRALKKVKKEKQEKREKSASIKRKENVTNQGMKNETRI